MRYDPDGNPKRRAKKGERRCGECWHHFCDEWGFYCVECAKAVVENDACCADDYAGDCRHFKAREVKP